MSYTGRTVHARTCSAILLAALLHPIAPSRVAAQSGEQGAACVRDFAPGLSCSSSDVRIAALSPVDVLDPCGSDGTATLTLDLTLSTADVPDRYDVAFYVALDGNNALDGGSCYHDYLDPPLTTEPVYPIHNGPWANLEPFDQNDSCGDMHGNTEVTKTLRTSLLPVQIACVDTDHDGWVDVSVCTAWRTGTSAPQGTCRGLSDAIAGSSDRCGCQRVDVLPEPGSALSLASCTALLWSLGRRRDPRTSAARKCPKGARSEAEPSGVKRAAR
jgi:hypothetical protein